MVKNKEKLAALIERFKGVRILVYGDFVLDEYLYGHIERISREAPVFIVVHEESEYRPGCAANAVANLAALGARPLPCGIIGNDGVANGLLSAFDNLGVETKGLVQLPGVKTPLKTRVIAGGVHSIKQQIVRIDKLKGASGGAKAGEIVKEKLEGLIPDCDAAMISDYGVGALSPEVGAWLVRKAKDAEKPVFVDSRYRLLHYTGITAATPNKPEAEACFAAPIDNLEELHEAGKELISRLQAEALIITRGGEGMTLFRPGLPPLDIPAFGDEEIVDVTGAGDTVIAAFTLAYSAGRDFELAADLANVAGGLTVLKKGTFPVSAGELMAAL